MSKGLEALELIISSRRKGGTFWIAVAHDCNGEDFEYAHIYSSEPTKTLEDGCNCVNFEGEKVGNLFTSGMRDRNLNLAPGECKEIKIETIN